MIPLSSSELEILIRLAVPAESECLSALALRSKAHWGYSPEFMEACREELWISPDKVRKPEFHYLIAEIRGEIVGFYALERLSPSELELEALFVEPRYIGTGVGRALMIHAIGNATAIGSSVLRVQSDQNAAAFYQAAGGVLTREKESASIPGRFLPVFVFELKPG